MTRVSLARTAPEYSGLTPPFHPGANYPELAELFGEPDEPGLANPVYAAVRAALFALDLDGDRFGTPAWNPLGTLVQPGGRIVLKPNFIRHWNPTPGATVESVITHGSVVRAVADYAFLAAGPSGSVTIAEAPQHDCDMERIREIAGLDALVAFYAANGGRVLDVIDLRRETARYEDGVIVERRTLPGDPRGYRSIDLGERSCFHGSDLDPRRFRGADYEPSPTVDHHTGGRNEYLLSETVLSADLIVNLPKLKTHKKTGVTLALKNMVGINGDKNWLPHHCVGAPDRGGDEFPENRWLDRARSHATEFARRSLGRGRGIRVFRAARRVETALRGDGFVRSGNWWGNRTTWRMCVDLNRCLYYSDTEGQKLEAKAPVRTVLTVMDAVVAGEGEGPLAPRDVPLGAVFASIDPVALDLAAVRLMGFDERRLPKVMSPMQDDTLRFTGVRSPGDVEVVEIDAVSLQKVSGSLDRIRPDRAFEPHSGWRGHVERTGA